MNARRKAPKRPTFARLGSALIQRDLVGQPTPTADDLDVLIRGRMALWPYNADDWIAPSVDDGSKRRGRPPVPKSRAQLQFDRWASARRTVRHKIIALPANRERAAASNRGKGRKRDDRIAQAVGRLQGARIPRRFWTRLLVEGPGVAGNDHAWLRRLASAIGLSARHARALIAEIDIPANGIGASSTTIQRVIRRL